MRSQLCFILEIFNKNSKLTKPIECIGLQNFKNEFLKTPYKKKTDIWIVVVSLATKLIKR